MDEVLVAMTVSADRCGPRSAKMRFLISAFSVAASMTSPASLNSAVSVVSRTGFDDQSGVPELGGVGGQPHAIERRLEVRFGNPALGKLAAEIFLDIRFACLRTLNRDIGQD